MPDIPRDPRQLARDILSGKIKLEDLQRERQRQQGVQPAPQKPGAQTRQVEIGPGTARPMPGQAPPRTVGRPLPPMTGQAPPRTVGRPLPPMTGQAPPRTVGGTLPPIGVKRPAPAQRMPPSRPVPAPVRQDQARRPAPSAERRPTSLPPQQPPISDSYSQPKSPVAPIDPNAPKAARLPRTTSSIRDMVTSRQSLRQAVLMSEIMGKPIGLRD